jgi:hypothetical protein
MFPHTSYHLNMNCIRHAKRFPPIYVRYMSDPSPIPPHFPSGQGYLMKPVKTAWSGERTARRTLRKSLGSRMSYHECFTLIPP